MIADIDINPLLSSLFNVSGGRVLREGVYEVENEICTLQIPVREPNPGDLKDIALRRFTKAWLREHANAVDIKSLYEPLPPGTSFFLKTGEEVPVMGKLNFSWHPRREKTDLEVLQDQQKKWKGTRPKHVK
tara:strand:- start:1469 stop:1861 length:393 start_codon:yes stop_codon:yes gene_type:complete